MKKFKFLGLLILGLFITTGAFAYPSPTYSSYTDKSDRANADFPGTPVRVLKWVRYSQNGVNNTSLVSGDAVIYDTISDDGVSVNTTTLSADMRFAGICVTAIPTSDNTTTTKISDDWGRKNWGWIIVDGPAVANATAGGMNGAVAGDPFVTSTDAVKITTYSAMTVDVTGAAASTTNTKIAKAGAARGGFFLDTVVASDTTAKVFVKSN